MELELFDGAELAKRFVDRAELGQQGLAVGGFHGEPGGRRVGDHHGEGNRPAGFRIDPAVQVVLQLAQPGPDAVVDLLLAAQPGGCRHGGACRRCDHHEADDCSRHDAHSNGSPTYLHDLILMDGSGEGKTFFNKTYYVFITFGMGVAIGAGQDGVRRRSPVPPRGRWPAGGGRDCVCRPASRRPAGRRWRRAGWRRDGRGS